MSQTFAPYGFRPVGVTGQEYNTNGISEFPLTTDNTAAISIGDPVAVTAGSITVVTASPTATLGANTPIGICWGFSYIDSMGKIWETPYLPQGAVNTLGFTRITVKVIDDDRATMYLCPNAPSPLPATCLGQNAPITNFGFSGTKTNSTIALDVANIGTSSALAVRILRIDRPDDAYPDVLVKWNFGVHYYQIGTAR